MGPCWRTNREHFEESPENIVRNISREQIKRDRQKGLKGGKGGRGKQGELTYLLGKKDSEWLG